MLVRLVFIGCFAVLVLPWIGGCDSDEAVVTDEVCERHSDCSDPSALCFEGVCKLECGDSRDCAEGEICSGGVCVAQTFNCGSSADCPFTMVCVLGVCESTDMTSSGCESNAECDSGQACIQGECTAVAECAIDSDCEFGQVCAAGTCIAECAENRDCASNEICEAGACRPECIVDTDCNADQSCVGGACVQGPTECVLHSDCPAGEMCSGEMCVVDTRECVLDSDCMTGEVCDAANNCVSVAPVDYGGTFLLSSTDPIQNCNPQVSIQYESRTVVATQDGGAYTWTFPTSTYNGTIDPATSAFTVSWSGSQGLSACGDLNTDNLYNGSFQNADRLDATLRMEAFFSDSSCNCTLYFPIVGTRQ